MVPDVDLGSVCEKGISLASSEPPPEHGVGCDVDGSEARPRVRLVLRRDHDDLASHGANRLNGLHRSGHHSRRGDPHRLEQLPVPRGRALDPFRGHPSCEDSLERRTHVVDHPLHIDSRADLRFERGHGGADAGTLIDEGHVEVEAHDQPVTVSHRRILPLGDHPSQLAGAVGDPCSRPVAVAGDHVALVPSLLAVTRGHRTM